MVKSEQEKPVFSRRKFLGGSAAATAVAAGIGRLISSQPVEASRQTPALTTNLRPQSEITASPERPKITEYAVSVLNLVGDEFIGLIQTPDRQYHVVTGMLDPATRTLGLESKGQVPFLPSNVCACESDPNIIAVVGKKSNSLEERWTGRLRWTKDNGKTWRIYEGEAWQGSYFAASITPDGNYAIIIGGDPHNEDRPRYGQFDLNTGVLTWLTEASSAIKPGSLNTLRNTAPGIYTAYGKPYLDRGYLKNTFNLTNGTSSSIGLNQQEGYATGRLIQYADQGHTMIWLLDTILSPNLTTLYINTDDVPAAVLQPTIALHPEGDLRIVWTGAADTLERRGYMGVTSTNVRDIPCPSIEVFGLDNTGERSFFSKTGDWPEIGVLSDLYQKTVNGEKYLVAAFQEMQRPGSGICVFNSTSGKWESVFVQLPYHQVYLPSVVQ